MLPIPAIKTLFIPPPPIALLHPRHKRSDAQVVSAFPNPCLDHLPVAPPRAPSAPCPALRLRYPPCVLPGPGLTHLPSPWAECEHDLPASATFPPRKHSRAESRRQKNRRTRRDRWVAPAP